MKKFIVIIALVALFSCSVFAANSNVGTSGFTFFKLDFSARANAMGGAYTALSNDVNAVFFNPAGLSQISEKQITTTYNSYLVGLSSGALAFSMPYEDRTIAFFSQFLTDEEDEVSSDGVITGTFDNSELLVGISASQQVHPVVFIGGSLKYLRENLAGNSENRQKNIREADMKLFNENEPIIGSLLETDTYKIRMLYYLWTFFPEVKT